MIAGTIYGTDPETGDAVIPPQTGAPQPGSLSQGEKGWPNNIEHLKPKSKGSFPALALVFTNLVGCCDSKYSGQIICNAAKSDVELKSLNPVTGAGLERITYEPKTGRLVTMDADLTDDLVLLNLNCKALCQARLEVEKGLREKLTAAQKRGRFKEELETQWRRFTVPESGLLPEFVEVALRYLTPKAKREKLI